MTVKTEREQEETAIEQLRQQVDANAPDADIVSPFNPIQSYNKSIQKAENDFWDIVAGFLTPMQQAKLFLRGHPKK